MNTIPNITLKDDRTDRTYSVSVYDEKYKEHAIKKLQEKMDYDYFESLPAEVRANKKKTDLHFTCPHCLIKTEVSSRKEKITTGFLFFITTRLVDIFHCHKCNKEFFSEDLRNSKESHYRQNILIENFENWKDAKRDGKNPPEFASLDKVDEFIISFSPHTRELIK